jgi:GT2 family glycosyltransferase
MDNGQIISNTSVLICSRNRPKFLRETIASILSAGETPAELIIVDQSDTIDAYLSTFQPQKNCSYYYLWDGIKGVSRGRNKAAAAASHSILVFTDDDVFVTPNWLSEITKKALAAGPEAIITGRVLSSEESETLFSPSTRTDEKVSTYTGRVKRDVLFTNNMAMHRSTFIAVGGFDPCLGPGTLYPAAEDNDLGFRLLEAGCSIIYDPIPTLIHRAWRNEQEILRLNWNYGIGQGAFYAKYFSLRDLFMIKRMLSDIWAYLSRFPFRFVKRRRQAYMDALFAAGILYGAIRWLVRSPRKSND